MRAKKAEPRFRPAGLAARFQLLVILFINGAGAADVILPFAFLNGRSVRIERFIVGHCRAEHFARRQVWRGVADGFRDLFGDIRAQQEVNQLQRAVDVLAFAGIDRLSIQKMPPSFGQITSSGVPAWRAT